LDFFWIIRRGWRRGRGLTVTRAFRWFRARANRLEIFSARRTTLMARDNLKSRI
jgi:hypothetical protein